jgi:signal transduction histidine kinase
MLFSLDEYKKEKDIISNKIFYYIVIYVLILIAVSLLFALYTTNPLNNALKLNDEFIKDIVHDINTPLSALRINLKILNKEFGENDAIKRCEYSIINILSLQDNMSYFLNSNISNTDKVDLVSLLNTKVQWYKHIYHDIDFSLTINKTATLNINKNALNRILDNIISNACKYNKKNGSVDIKYKNNILIIKDTGIGIKNTKKIFDRYYKENDKGIGIGLNVVKKLCDSCLITIKIKSLINIGTEFMLVFDDAHK